MTAALATRVRPKSDVTYVGSAKAEHNSGTSLDIVMPTGLANNDWAVFSMSVDDSTTVAPPSGYTEEVNILPDDVQHLRLYVWTTRVNAADSSTTKTFTKSGTTNNSAILCVSVYRNVGGYSCTPGIYRSTGVEVLNNRVKRCCSLWPGPNDRLVACIGTSSYSSTAAAAPLVTGVPSGWTLRQADTAQDTALILPRGNAIMDAPSHPLQEENYTTTNQAHNCSVTFALAPEKPRDADMEKVPSSLMNKATIGYTTSSAAFVKKTDVLNSGYYTRWTWLDRITRAMGNDVDSRNFSLPGSKSPDICAFMFGNRTSHTRAVSGDPLAVNQVGTWVNLPDKTGAVFLDVSGNDELTGGGSAKALLGVENALRAMIRRIRSGVVLTSTNAAITYGGTWTTVASDGRSGGTSRQTTVPGSTATFPVNAATAGYIDWNLIGVDSVDFGAVGSTYRLSVDGVEYKVGTTNDQMETTGWGSGPAYESCQMVEPVWLTAGAHSIVLEHTGSNGQVLIVDSIQSVSATPPVVVVMGLQYNPAAATAYAVYGYSLEMHNTITQILKDVVSEFTDGRVLFYDPNESGLWNPSTMAAPSPDFVHQTEIGHPFYGHELIDLLARHYS